MKHIKTFKKLFESNSYERISEEESNILHDSVGDYYKEYDIKKYGGKYKATEPYADLDGSRSSLTFENVYDLRDFLLINFHLKNYNFEEALDVLKKSKFDISLISKTLIGVACGGGSKEENIIFGEIGKIALKDKSLDEEFLLGMLKYACMEGCYPMVELLLNDGRFDPSEVSEVSNVPLCIEWADHYCCKDIVRLLAKDPRIKRKLTSEQIEKIEKYGTLEGFLN